MLRTIMIYSLLLAGLLVPSDLALAQLDSSDPFRFFTYLGSDVAAIGPSLINASPIALAGATSAIVATSGFDADLAERAQTFKDQELIRLFNEMGDVKAVRPFTFIVFVGSLMQRDHRVQDAAFTSLEAVVMANLATNSLKAVFGRARPFQEKGANTYEPFSGNTSFPSGHATTVFAAISPWVAYYPGSVTYAALALAGGTAVARISLRFHWPSDVLAGAAIGTATGVWLARRHQGKTSGTDIRPIAGPASLGLRIRW